MNMKKFSSLCLLCVLGIVPGASAQFVGGDGDGYDSETLSTSFPAFVNLYTGGDGDGYDSATQTTSFSAFADLYMGGSGDGYAGASLSTGTALPVELTRFEAVADGLAVVLSWDTASETNNAGFEMHSKRSLENSEEADWQVVGFVEGQGTTLEPQSYTFRIEDLLPGRHVFRFKQIDFDGAFEYSPEVEVALELVEAFYLSTVYPNPFNPRAQFTLMVRQEQSVRVAVYDVQGRRVALLHEGSLAAGTHHRFVFQGAALPSGLYLIRAEGQTFSAVRSVVLLK